jgi:alpha-tubulin suppressor-like RCC1 family protein
MFSAARLVALTFALATVSRSPHASSPVAARGAVSVGAPGAVTVVSGRMVWRTGRAVTLRGPLRVPAGAALEIEAGVTVEAATGASIVVERNGRLNVTGTQFEPVVLTCPNNASTPGCWDGLVVLGHAPINHGTLTSPAGGRGGAGGCRESTLDGALYGGCTADDSSGVLRFVRVQYATHGLRLFGVGSKTVVQDVQVHRSTGHGLEVVGGTVPLRHLALTTNAQYGFVYSGGWTGQAQYVVIQQDATGYAGGLLGRNAQGAGGNQSATPRSAPTLANLTIVAPPSAAGNPYAGAAPAALRFDRGAAGQLYNVLLIQSGIAIDLDDAATCAQATGGSLRVQGVGLTAPAAVADPDADAAECAPTAEADLLATATTVTGVDAAIQLQSALNVVLPDLRARPGSVIALATGVAPTLTGNLEAVTYLGAVAPSASFGAIPWYSGWTLGEQLAAPALVTLNGIVTAPGRGGVAGVQVQVGPSGLTATTNALGQFAIAGVPTGPVEVAFTGGVPADCATPEVIRATANGGSMTLADVSLACGPPAPALVSPSIVAGSEHNCGLTSAGVAYCWGGNGSGELGDGTAVPRSTPTLVSGGQAFTTLTAGSQHTCGLTTAGAAYCWGRNTFGQLGDPTTTQRLTPTAVSGGQLFVALTAGFSHTCGLTSAGAAYCWGDNGSGQLGDGTTTNRLVPTAVDGGQTFVALTAGSNHTCGLTSARAASCWGSNGSLQLGDGTNTPRLVPTLVNAGPMFTTLGAGNGYTCGLTSVGAAYCWGNNGQGQLGDGTMDSRGVPAPVSGGQTFTTLTLSVAGNHTCGVTSARAAYCWGSNGSGKLGDGSTEPRLTPTLVSGGHAFTTLAAGINHTCGVTSAGAAFCWGSNGNGQLGVGTTGAQRVAPTLVSGGQAFENLAVGWFTTCGLTTGGIANCWGDNFAGKLGNGTTNASGLSPTLVAGGHSFATLSTSGNHSCAVTTAGATYCWGFNNFGQLGDGTTTEQRVPTLVGGAPVFTMVTVGGTNHTCGLTAAGAAYCWGNNVDGRLGDGTTTTRSVPTLVTSAPNFAMLTAGEFHSCGLTTAGAAYCWGANATGQLGDGTVTSRTVPTLVSTGHTFVALTAGGGHTCGLTSNGSAYCWGLNNTGQLGDATITQRLVPTLVSGGQSFAAVSAGYVHTCGRTSIGAAYCWGANSSGQLGDGTTTLRATPTLVSSGPAFASIGAGRDHSCGLTSAGAAYCWGNSANGQLGIGGGPRPVLGGIVFRVP